PGAACAHRRCPWHRGLSARCRANARRPPHRRACRSGAMRLSLIVNGEERCISTVPARRLADVLRDELGLTGTKIGCNAGDCGASPGLLDGAQVCSCLIAAARAAGRSIVTVEGLAQDGALNALQAAFHRHGAAQCGICTPGMLIAASDLLARVPHPDEQSV